MRTVKDIQYFSDTGQETEHCPHQLDLYLPSQCEWGYLQRPGAPGQGSGGGEGAGVDTCSSTLGENVGPEKRPAAPVVLFVHGGGWRRGARQSWTHFLYSDVNLLVAVVQWFVRMYANVGEEFARRGIACAVISYPLTGLACPYLFLELTSSYICSCLAILLTLTPLLIMAPFYNSVVHNAKFPSWTRHSDVSNFVDIAPWLVALLLLATNVTILALFTFKRVRYGLRQFHVIAMWTLVVFVYFLTKDLTNINQMIILFLVTLVTTQGTLLRIRLSRCDTTYVDQANAVARAFKWVKDYAELSEGLDEKKLFLMGHSAGGHLVSLVSLDDQFLTRAGCTIADVKGVISLSGVYDLTCLDKRLLRQFYLHPTFGTNRDGWLAASPADVVTKVTDVKRRTKYLLMCAEKDLMLRIHSHQFGSQLNALGIKSDHVEVPGTNHFSIIVNLGKTFKGISLARYFQMFIEEK